MNEISRSRPVALARPAVGERESGAVAPPPSAFAVGNGRGEYIGEATVVGLHLADLADETGQAVPGVGIT